MSRVLTQKDKKILSKYRVALQKKDRFKVLYCKTYARGNKALIEQMEVARLLVDLFNPIPGERDVILDY
jgi:hypothetical protein